MEELPADLLFFFLEGLTRDAKGGNRTSFEPFVGDFLSAPLADAIRVGGEASERVVDFFQQLPLTFPDSQRKVLIHFRRGLITDVGKTLCLGTIGQHFPSLFQDGGTLSFKVATNVQIPAAGRGWGRPGKFGADRGFCFCLG